MAMDTKTILRLMGEIAKKPGTHTVAVGPDMPQAERRAVAMASQLGINVQSAAKVTPPPDGQKAVLCCIEVTEPLTMPDNKTGPCAWGCGRTIQYRPYHPDWIDKACLHCVAGRQEKDN